VPETTPTGEQIRFTSSVTGETILDAYLEACERGGRTLPSLLADLFDSSGVFRSDVVQFRVNSATRNLQTRAGDFASAEAGWVDIANGFIFRQRGAHANATAYEQLDVVTHNSSTYFCVTSHTSSSASPNLSNFALIIDGSNLVGLNSIDTFSLGGRAASGSFAGISIPTNTIAGRVTGDVKALTPAEAKTVIGLSAVEDKSSATIRSELTSLNVTTALGYTPYNSSNPAGYLTSITFGQVVGALGYTPLAANAVSSVAGRTGAITLTSADIAGGAPLASPAFTGTPTAPTAVGGTNNTQIATTAFVNTALAAVSGAVTSFNTRGGAITLTSGDVTTALGYTPSTFNPSNITTLMTSTVDGEGMRLQSTNGSYFSFYRLPSLLPSGFVGQANRLMAAVETLGLRGENGIAFSGNAGGSQQMTLLSNGRLGVGTTGPTSTVHAVTSGSDANITAARSDGQSISLIAGTTTAWLNTDSNVSITFGVNGTERMRLASTGLGIATAPESSVGLHVGGSNTIRCGGSGAANWMHVGYNGAGYLYAPGGVNLDFYAGANLRMTLDYTGSLSVFSGSVNATSFNPSNPVAARAAFGLGSAALNATADFANSTNLGVTNPVAARANLGLGSAALNATADFQPALGYTAANNAGLAGLSSPSTARSNLGLGNAATRNITTSTGGPSGGASGDIWFQVS
jgi:hypothetical protein